MNKLRSDSIFTQLTPEQAEKLEGWLLEERLGYKEALERVQKEFGLATSLTALRRLYQRLAMERSHESLLEALSACTEAATAVKTTGALQSGLLTLANKCAIELAVESPRSVRELTALLRAITCAEAQEIKRVHFQREEERLLRMKLAEERERERQKEKERKNAEDAEKERKLMEEIHKSSVAAHNARMAAREAAKAKALQATQEAKTTTNEKSPPPNAA